MKKAIVAAIVVAFLFLQRQKHEVVEALAAVDLSPVLLRPEPMHLRARPS